MATSSTSTTLALIQAAPMAREARSKKPTKRDKEIYLLYRSGVSTETLAVRYGVKEPAIKSAIERWVLERDSYNIEEQNLELAKMTSRLAPRSEKVLADAMKAEHTVNVGRGQKVIMKKVADHATRIKAVETWKSIQEMARPKGGGITVNTQVNNGKDGAGAPTSTRGFDFEARLRDIRERKGLKNDESVIEAEFEDGEETDALADELAEMGIELETDDDDDQDDEDESDDE
jgi:hypothetical protein